MLRAFLCFIRSAELTIAHLQWARELKAQPSHQINMTRHKAWSYLFGGEDEIRTHGTSCPVHTLSRRAPSTTRTPLHDVHTGRYRLDQRYFRRAAYVLLSLRFTALRRLLILSSAHTHRISRRLPTTRTPLQTYLLYQRSVS